MINWDFKVLCPHLMLLVAKTMKSIPKCAITNLSQERRKSKSHECQRTSQK